jgi:hypothetical protein
MSIPSRFRAALGVAAAAVVAGCGSAAPATVSVQGAPPHTQKVYVRPVTSTGAAVRGYRVTSHAAGGQCSAGSEAIGRAYRCFAGNGVYDPCWAEKASAPTVLCVPDPWARTAAELRVSAPLSAIPPADAGGAAEPWGVQLSGGQRCVLAQGAHNAFRGQVIDYYCPSGLSLLHGLNLKAATWTARSVLDKSGKLASGPLEKIAIAWYGRPALFR